MILLTTPTDALQVVTGAAATVNVHVTWVDTNTGAGTITPGRTNTAISTAATTSVAGAPAAGVQRNVKTLHIRNTHATLSCDTTVQHTDGTIVAQLYKRTLAPGEMLEYTDQGGFSQGVFGNVLEDVPQGCQLVVATGTSISLLPKNGFKVKIQGVLYDIGGGVTATITSCFLNGAAAQILLPSTTYNVYLFINAGVPTMDFSTTGHSRDASSGNKGVEIKTGDSSRSLIGKIFTTGTTGSPTIGDTTYNRNCISWFQRMQRVVIGQAVNAAASVTSGFQNIDMTNIGSFLTWGDEEIDFDLAGTVYCDTAGMIAYSNLSVDAGGTNPLIGNNQGSAPASGSFVPVSGTGMARLSEGRHYINVQGYVSAGTGTWNCGGTATFHG